jgi:hypothetical protein
MADTCRVCGHHFGIWIGPPMSDGLCPMTSERAICPDQQAAAHVAAMRRKTCPDCYDDTGKIKPDGLIRMIDCMKAAGLDWQTGHPLKREAADG